MQEQDGASFHTQSNGSGEFQVPALRADDYTVHVEASGFTTFEQKISLLLQRAYTLVVMALLIAVLGLGSTASVPIDIFPAINVPVVLLMA